MDTYIQNVDGVKVVTLSQSKSSLKRTFHKLIMCPWCMGVWIALCSLFVFYLIPSTYFLFLMLAISSLASFLQLLANLIGWTAEYRKIETEKLS
jgi:hypothetical protein